MDRCTAVGSAWADASTDTLQRLKALERNLSTTARLEGRVEKHWRGHATVQLASGGSGWWPKAMCAETQGGLEPCTSNPIGLTRRPLFWHSVRPSKVEVQAWSTIHMPLLRPPHKYVRLPYLYISHFRYQDFKRCPPPTLVDLPCLEKQCTNECDPATEMAGASTTTTCERASQAMRPLDPSARCFACGGKSGTVS